MDGKRKSHLPDFGKNIFSPKPGKPGLGDKPGHDKKGHDGVKKKAAEAAFLKAFNPRGR